MSSTVTAIAIAGSIVLSLTFAVVIVIVKRRMEVSTRYGGTSGQTQSGLLRAPPLVTYFIRSTESQGLFQSDIDLLCKEYKFEGMQSIQRNELNTLRKSEEQVSEVNAGEDIKTKASLCCICLEDLEVGSPVRTLPCNHTFHSKEICRWLCKRAICPYCRASFEYLTCVPNGEVTTEHFSGSSEVQANSNHNSMDNHDYIGFQRQSQDTYLHNNVVRSFIMIVP